MYVLLTFLYFFLLIQKTFYIAGLLYIYYFLIFFIYHLYFTFSKRFCYIVIIVLKNYWNKSEYLKIMLWFILVLLTSLVGDNFIFLFVFNPLFFYSIVTGNLLLFLVLLALWSWIFVLVYFNKFKICQKFLAKILQYFSRSACLHFTGNSKKELNLRKKCHDT